MRLPSTANLGDVMAKSLTKSRTALLVGAAIVTLNLSADPAAAGCKSGATAVAGEVLLSDPGCEASATGSGALAVGDGAVADEQFTTSIGFGAGSNGTTGDRNTWIGAGSGENVTGTHNTAVGFNSALNVNGNSNSAFGDQAGGSVFGNNNAAVGAGSGQSVFGDDNVTVGHLSGRNVDGVSNAAFGLGAGQQVTGDNNVAIGAFAGDGLTASNTVSIGTSALASADGAMAMGQNASASFTNSAAFGSGATATRANQQVFGTASNTYTMPGITSSASKSAQGSPTHIVTSNSKGDLAAYTPAELGIATGADLNALNQRISKATDESNSGIALAMSIQNPDLTGSETFGMAANWGAFENANALGMSLMGVLGHDFIAQGDRVALSGGFGVGLGTGDGDSVYGGRVGLQWTH